MTRLIELFPGDEVQIAGTSAVFVASSSPHPLFPALTLVVWRLDDGSWSHDALSVLQDVGTRVPSTPAERITRLRRVLLGSGAR